MRSAAVVRGFPLAAGNVRRYSLTRGRLWGDMDNALSLDDIRARQLAALIADVGIEPEAVRQPQTIITPEEDRVDSGMAVAYLLGKATVVRCDPALAPALGEIASTTDGCSLEEYEAWGVEQGWRFIDGGDQHVIAVDGLVPRAVPAEATLVQLDRDNNNDRTLIAALIGRNRPDDVDESGLDMGDLDPHIVGLLDNAGELRALASGLVWDADDIFDDIGVLTDEVMRGQGWGGAIVSAFCDASFARGRLPLYRCNWTRTASKALALSLGFELNMRVSAIGLPDES